MSAAAARRGRVGPLLAARRVLIASLAVLVLVDRGARRPSSSPARPPGRPPRRAIAGDRDGGRGGAQARAVGAAPAPSRSSRAGRRLEIRRRDRPLGRGPRDGGQGLPARGVPRARLGPRRAEAPRLHDLLFPAGVGRRRRGRGSARSPRSRWRPRAGQPAPRARRSRSTRVDHDYYALRGEDGGLAFVESAKVDLIPADPRQPADLAGSRARAEESRGDRAGAAAAPDRGRGERPRERGAGRPAVVARSLPRTSGALEPAALLSKVDPAYPEAARRAGVEGTVVLGARSTRTGGSRTSTSCAACRWGSRRAAVDAVRRWQYRPARGRAGPVASRKEVRIEFRLR